ncbi:hypothetical protein M724_11870, partial [Neisseria gonorrhoeae ATL_2011_01_05]
TECSRVSWNTMSGQRSCVSPKFTRLDAPDDDSDAP